MTERRERARALASLLAALLLLAASFAGRARHIEQPSVERRGLKDYIIDLNGADAEHLTLLHGIGPRLAGAIVAWRERNGPIRGIEDLLEIRGIGARRAEAILRNAVLGGVCRGEAGRGDPVSGRADGERADVPREGTLPRKRDGREGSDD